MTRWSCRLSRAAVAMLLAAASPSFAQPPEITRRELLKCVDRNILANRHHVDLNLLAEVDSRVFLSIDIVDPASPRSGDILGLTYTLTNFTRQRAQGTTIGRFQGQALVAPDGSPPGPIDLAPGQSITSQLRTAAPVQAGTDVVALSYRDRVACHRLPGPKDGPVEVCVAAVTADASASVTTVADPAAGDADQDGIPDVVETELLARFRPFYRFSKYYDDDEGRRPADALWFVQHSELQDHHSETDGPVLGRDQLTEDASRILRASSIGPSDLAARPQETEYHLNLANEFRSGEASWDRIVAEATGLYGHVAPLRENPADPAVITAYKIEYWQLYAFNPVPGQLDCWIVAGPAKGSDAHEGDWEAVELVVDADPPQPVRRVRHNVHSTDVVFEVKGQPISLGGGFVEYRGTDAGDSFDLYVNRDSEARHNRRVRLYCNEDGCTHPVVYIEHGGHASWPTGYWFWPGVLNHDGNSPHAYLVAPPVNLGEVGYPNSECPACALVVGFNGHWGACGGDPPHGPPLHGSWGNQ